MIWRFSSSVFFFSAFNCLPTTNASHNDMHSAISFFFSFVEAISFALLSAVDETQTKVVTHATYPHTLWLRDDVSTGFYWFHSEPTDKIRRDKSKEKKRKTVNCAKKLSIAKFIVRFQTKERILFLKMFRLSTLRTQNIFHFHSFSLQNDSSIASHYLVLARLRSKLMGQAFVNTPKNLHFPFSIPMRCHFVYIFGRSV